jgi:hypothetical protein
MGRGAPAGNRSRTTKILVTAQVAVSLVLLIGAGLFIRTLYNLQTQSSATTLTACCSWRVDPIAAGYRGDDIGRACIELMHRLEALPGVRTVTFSENGLFTGTESTGEVDVSGFTPATRDDRQTRFDQVGPRYFTNVGIPLVAGRDFSEADGPGRTRVAVINETMGGSIFRTAIRSAVMSGLSRRLTSISKLSASHATRGITASARRRCGVSTCRTCNRWMALSLLTSRSARTPAPSHWSARFELRRSGSTAICRSTC